MYFFKVAAVEGMKRFSGDPVFRFYYGVALVLEGRTQEGIRELDPLQQYSEVKLSPKGPAAVQSRKMILFSYSQVCGTPGKKLNVHDLYKNVHGSG